MSGVYVGICDARINMHTWTRGHKLEAMCAVPAVDSAKISPPDFTTIIFTEISADISAKFNEASFKDLQ